MNPEIKILKLHASASGTASNSRKLGDHLVTRLENNFEKITTRERDLNQQPEFIDSDWIAANLTAAEDRNKIQQQRLALSDQLIEELQWADQIILTTPMYNFGVPAVLKAWIDLVCRAGVTFRYTSEGPVGLLRNKRIDVIITTGGAPLHSPVDFVSGYLNQIFKFIGIDQIAVIGADRMNLDAEASFARALDQIETMNPARAA